LSLSSVPGHVMATASRTVNRRERDAQPFVVAIGGCGPKAAVHARAMTVTITSTAPLSVAVIGGGLAGAFCARTLMAHPRFAVQVLEQGHDVGGRLSTRRMGRYQFDVGAQYFTVRDARFQTSVERWRQDGLVREWSGRLCVVEQGRRSACEEKTRYVGVPDMQAVVRQVVSDCRLRRDTAVAQVRRDGAGWRLLSTMGEDLGVYDLVVTAVPAPQVTLLLGDVPQLAARAATVHMASCWAVVLVFAEPLEVPFDGAFVRSSALSWIARDSNKPGRSAADCWVLHASPAWSDMQRATTPEAIMAELTAELWQATGTQARQPVFAQAVHWPHALPLNPLQETCLFDPVLGAGACGDWCGGPRVEGAFVSGLGLAEQILLTVCHKHDSVAP
jgi:renalase